MKSPPPDPDPFPPVLESSLGMSFTTGGDDSWHGTTLEGYNDDDCAESGYINDDQESWLQTTVDVNDQQETLTFWWKVSSEEDCDFLQFYIDDDLQHQISGEVGWHKKSYDISEQGSHTLKWRYFKDYADPNGYDSGRVDWVQWSGAPDPTPDPPPDPTKWKTIDYTYDPGGRRIKKTIDDDYSLKYIYDGGNVIAEYDHDNFLLRKYIYGPGVDEPVCMIDAVDNDAEYYYHRDGLGSVVALSDSNGDTVQTYEYSIYGQVAAEDPNFLTNPYLFTGRRFDLETGLYYYRARYYNPYIGRFLQTDLVGYSGGMNLYTYCLNNPVMLVDASGCAPSSDTLFSWYKLWTETWGDVIKFEEAPNWRTLIGWYPVGSGLPYICAGSDATEFLLGDRDVGSQIQRALGEHVTYFGWDDEPGTYDIQWKTSVAFNKPYSWDRTGFTKFFISGATVFTTGTLTVGEEENKATLTAQFVLVDWMDLHPEKFKLSEWEYYPDMAGTILERIWNRIVSRHGGTEAQPYPFFIETETVTINFIYDEENMIYIPEDWSW